MHACGLVILRPDHFVAAAALNQQATAALRAVTSAASLDAGHQNEGSGLLSPQQARRL
jgi:3-(3-hydroxy-phenyl)propionate hydroxylase